MARVCHQNKCPVGVATQDPELRKRFAGRPEHIVNYFTFVAEEVRELLAGLGLRTLGELVGRADLLELAEAAALKTDGLDRYWFEGPAESAGQGRRGAGGRAPAPAASAAARRRSRPAARATRSTTGCSPTPRSRPPIAGHGRVTRRATVVTRDRAVGARLAGEVAARHGDARLPRRAAPRAGRLRRPEPRRLPHRRRRRRAHRRGQRLRGQGHGRRRDRAAAGGARASAAPASVIAGNTCLYGATGGRLFAAGRAGERFAVRNSAATAVVEGAGDHCCEYMTGGVVAVLGSVGRNACAGMTGGTAYFLADAPPAWLDGHATVADAGMDAAAVAELSGAAARPTRRAPAARRPPRFWPSRRPSRAASSGSALRAARPAPAAPAAPAGVFERDASVTQAQHTLVAYARSREYAPREIRGAGVGPATCPERRPHGD